MYYDPVLTKTIIVALKPSNHLSRDPQRFDSWFQREPYRLNWNRRKIFSLSQVQFPAITGKKFDFSNFYFLLLSIVQKKEIYSLQILIMTP